MSNIVEVMPRVGVVAKTKPLWQYDSGQIIRVTGITLPATYKAEFSNGTRGNAVPTVQTTDEITVPAQFLQSGNPVYIWLVVVDENSRTTEYAIMTTVTPRSQPTDETPTPEEQSEIDQAIAALNSGVSRVEGIADAIPDTINDALEAAKESGEFDGADGISPSITITDITGGHRIAITDANGTHTVDVLDGAKGDTGRGIVSVQKTGTAGLVDTYTITYTDNTTSTFTVVNGQNGTPGADGTTFTPAVSAEGVISWTNDGGETNPQPVNIKGTPGNDGTSPTVSVADITGGHRVTVTDANGTRSFDVMDGEDYVLSAADKAEIAQQAAEEVDVPVQDVQVNGTSVVTDGVANVPLGTENTPGVVRPYASYGTRMIGSNNDLLATSLATDSEAKAGTNQYKPIVPSNQHVSAFYALAKAAGADMASSSNPVGTYTDAAKVAIQKMLGIYEAPWELIREDEVTNATEADVEITVDGNGNPFELTDVRIEFYSPVQQTTFTKGDYGRICFFYGTGSSAYDSVLIGAYTQNTNETAKYSYAIIEQNDGMVTKIYMVNTTSGSNGQLRAYAQPTGMFYIANRTYSKIVITKVTGTAHYKLYGKRKWS